MTDDTPPALPDVQLTNLVNRVLTGLREQSILLERLVARIEELAPPIPTTQKETS